MSRTIPRLGRSPLFAALLFMALCTRALIPVGYMPGPGGLVFCGGYAPVSGTAAPHAMAHDMGGMDMSDMGMSDTAAHPSHDDGTSKHESWSLCPYAAAAGAMLSGHAPSLVTALLQPPSRNIEFPPQQFIPRSTLLPTRLPRGPPLLA